jgi:glycogen debranching enzyme
LGFDQHADQLKEALVQAFKRLGKIPELYGVVGNQIVDLSNAEDVWANPLQAWSSAGLLEMLWRD